MSITYEVRITRPTRQRKIAAMSQSAPPPILSVAPTRALVDETLRVRVDNLPPRAPVTLRCEHRSEDKDYWEAYGHYVSDAAGAVSVADDLSLGGTYCGREAMGLLWSMRPVPGSRTGLRLRKRNVRTPMLFTISVFAGHVDRDFDGRPPLARELVERWYAAPGVRRVEVEDRGVRGTLFIPSGPGPFPGLLDMWGGGGGLLEYRSALLASHGYVSLALEYFAPGELASTDLEFQYFEVRDGRRRYPSLRWTAFFSADGLRPGPTASRRPPRQSGNIRPFHGRHGGHLPGVRERPCRARLLRLHQRQPFFPTRPTPESNQPTQVRIGRRPHAYFPRTFVNKCTESGAAPETSARFVWTTNKTSSGEISACPFPATCPEKRT
ncbi:peroxisomal succinyl-coenzyme A thioesterase-like isoform X4 [Corythoichthys intestinalis]|uniref:peroxisomal succinyl-coenzyme A thioesterase-like isoform X4 n=1 Tax=Corythoichthys intestinalis TaxID=161448 RepID=UPI0025A571B2|nr:peroxisomal succinyl-coenzyme A thioesterase-like isoform X4 [Corythoichthys intestinalis]